MAGLLCVPLRRRDLPAFGPSVFRGPSIERGHTVTHILELSFPHVPRLSMCLPYVFGSRFQADALRMYAAL